MFAATTTLIFVVPDYALGDNNGGVSVLVKPAVSTPSPPLLSIAPGPGTNVTVYWPTNVSGFILAETASLNPASWSDVTPLPGVVDTNYVEVVPGNSGNRFFRLHNP